MSTPLSTSSSGSYAVKRIRQSGTYDVGTAHSALELLGENNLYGFLVVSDGLRDVCFFFTRGGLRVVASGFELPTIASRLVQQGVITKDEARKTARLLQEESSKGGKDERGVLLERVRIKAPQVDAATREILVEVFLDCLFWPEPRYEVATGSLESELAGRRDLSALTLSLGIQGMVDEVRSKLRTVSEVRRTVSSLNVSVEATAEGREALKNRQLGEGETGKRRMRFMRKVEDDPGIRAPDLAEKLQIGELELARTLHELSVEGLLKIHRVKRSKREELERIRKMEEAIDHALSQLLRRVRLAKETADQGETGKAARHMARAGGILLHQGRDDEAVRTFATALKHSEEDLEAREGYVNSLYGCGRKDEAARESDTLGQRYLELGMPTRAKGVIERSLLHEDRASGLQLLVKTHLKLRQPKAAVEAGERLVNRLRREGRREDAQNAAASLLAYADPMARKRILRAAGIDSRMALVLVVTLIGMVLGIVPLHGQLSVRQAYAQETRQAKLALQQIDATDPIEDLERWHETFTAHVAAYTEEEEIAAHAAQTAEKLGAYAHDLALFRTRLGKYFPAWEDQVESLKAFGSEVEEVRKEVQTPELGAQLDAVLKEVKAMRERGADQQDALGALPPGPDAVLAARDMCRIYEGDSRLLSKSQIRIRVRSEPTGARVTWKGVTYSSPTPSVLRLPLEGDYLLRLELLGYVTVERKISLATLPQNGEVLVQLEAAPNYVDPTDRKDPEDEGPEIKITVVDPDPPPRDPPPRDDPPPTNPDQPVEQPDPPPADDPPKRTFENASFEIQEQFSGDDPGVMIRSSLRVTGDLSMPPTYRCLITVNNETRGERVFLRSIDLQLRTRSSRGAWKLNRAVRITFDNCERKILRQRGREVMQGLDNVHGLTSAEMLEELQDALEEAVTNYRRKTFR